MQAKRTSRRIVSLMAFTVLSASLSAQTQTKPVIPEQTPQASAWTPAPPATVVPPGYVIGADDLLSIRFWSDTKRSADVVVRPDGKISIPLLNDVQAAGLTPEQLNAALEKLASKYIAEPDATVIVKEVRSRKVYVLGQVARPNTVTLNADMNVLQVLTAVGGLLEYADKGNIIIVRAENGRERRFKFNYND